ncbi:MAG TPA: ABC transporter substrate-binding protein [Candidatus Paceibacterota bacterium]|nr:ABC transporter substrate-binding protein [Candidatus Paceibacterota bacterium]
MFNNDHHPIEDFFGVKHDAEKGQQKQPLKEAVKRPSLWSRLRLLPKVLSIRERYFILLLLIVGGASLVAIPFTSYYHYTQAAPAPGGAFSEGVVGEPRHVNPLLSQTNDADRDLVSLTYSSLLKYNPDGKLVPDLAKSYDISSDELNYTVYLKDNAVWSDGQPVTADDVVFTIQTAQNADYGSLQRINWQGVEVQKVNDATVIFKLKTKYAQFLNNFTIGILPKHIWENVKPINFGVSDFNLKPVGSGPYIFSKLQKDDLGRIKSYELVANKNYYDGRPYIDTITLKFYDTEDQMIDAYNNNDIQNLSYISPRNIKKLKFKQRLDIKTIDLPRYFGVFFNQTANPILADKNVRLALNYGTDRQALVDNILNGNGNVIYSPLIENVLGIGDDITKYAYDPAQAQTILEAAGWTKGSDGILRKNNAPLAVHITTSTFPELADIANLLKDQWSALGVQVTVDVLAAPQLQQVIKERSYEALLFGEILNLDPDPFSLWHSSQTKDPGLNLALYSNTTADGILESARQTLNPADRAKKYDDFQKLVIADAPVVVLYNPVYLYPQTSAIKGFDASVISMPSDRFSNIESWYIDTKRVGK